MNESITKYTMSVVIKEHTRNIFLLNNKKTSIVYLS